jgi:3-hydroxyacyl-CoA dehydrogenase/enoyl-CoA hydratase/carnithine racemase
MTAAPSINLETEVVTQALVRYLQVPGLAGEVALITLDNGRDHTRPSTLGPGGLANLDNAITEIESHQPAVSAIAITGKPFVFCVGADLTAVALIRSRDQAYESAQEGHRIFRRLRDSSVPTFAFINGAVMGGGLELALHCSYRTVARGVSAIGLPEVSLGLVPGWGGTQLLPALIGPDAAVTVIIENPLNQNALLAAQPAADLGIADAVFDDADFLAQSLGWAARVLSGSDSVPRSDHADDDWSGALDRGRRIAAAKLAGGAPAAQRALELIASSRTADFTTGTAAEDAVLADALMSEQLRASLYAFELVRSRSRKPAGAPDRSVARPVTKVGVIGAGLMATQLALLFARRLEVPIVMTDVDEKRLSDGVARVHAEIAKLAERGRLTPAKANRLTGAVTGSLDYRAFDDADLVIEAVFEDLAVKQHVLSELEQYVDPAAVLATNTSALSVSAMAEGLHHPERVVGLHFFNPVAVLPLVEVVRGERTDDTTLATAFAVTAGLRKSAVLVRDAPGFVVNRLLTRLLGEVFAATDEGTAIEVVDSALTPLGLPMSPFQLLGLVGPAVALHVAETLHESFPDRFRVSANLQRLVAAGKPGVYVWTDGRPRIDPEAAALFGPGDRPRSGDEIRERAERALADEIGRMLVEGVVATPADIDACLVLGAGWPLHDGGITPYLDRNGTSELVNGRRFLPTGVASLPR